MLKDTETYRLIKASTKTWSLTYYIDTYIPVTNENIESIISIENDRYKIKLTEANALSSLKLSVDDIVRKQINRFLNKTLLHTQTIYVTAENIDDASEQAEKLTNFHSWCVN